jgi:hypothetical protein
MMTPVDDDFKLTDQTVQRMVDLLRDGISVEFIVQGLKFHHVRPALTHYLKGPLVCCPSGLMATPDWLSNVVRVERLATIIAEHRAGEVRQLAAYADVLTYLYPAASAQYLPDRWAAIYSHVLNTTLARHELPADEAAHQTACLSSGEGAQLIELRQDLCRTIVRLARLREIAWPGRPLPVSSDQVTFRQLAQRQPEQTICLNVTQEKINNDPKTKIPSFNPSP